MSLVGARPHSVEQVPPRVRLVRVPQRFPYECVCGDDLHSLVDWWLHRCNLAPGAYRGERRDRCLL